LQIEAATVVTTPEVAGSDLPDQLAAVLMKLRDPTFAGVVKTARDAASSIDRFDRRAAQ
jgi:hypothetical protein